MLQDKVVLITGASRGIGFEICKKFLFLGSNISICSTKKKELIKIKKKNLIF